MNFSEIENLVFEGGGVRALAYIGALRYLEEQNLVKNIKNLAGSSAGGIIATAISLGWTSVEIETLIKQTDLRQFQDTSSALFNVLRHWWNIISKKKANRPKFKYQYGFYDGKKFQDWFEESVILPKTGSRDTTFKQLYDSRGIVLVIPAACVNQRRLHLYHYQSNPNMKISDAVRITMSLPYFFKAIVWESDVLIDAGTFNNYPLFVFDQFDRESSINVSEILSRVSEKNKPAAKPANKSKIELVLPNTKLEKYETSRAFISDPNYKTLGLKLLDSSEQVFGLYSGNAKIKNMMDFSTELVNAVLLQIERMQVDQSYWERTVPIYTGNVNTTDFDITNAKISWLISSAYEAIKNFHHGQQPSNT